MKFNFLSIEPHSFEELRLSLAEAGTGETDFITLLKEHHDYLEESIDILIDPDSELADKKEHLSRFLILLDMHGHAEEETLYRKLISNDKRLARTEGLGGQQEHDIAYQLSDELIAMEYNAWWTDAVDAKAKVLASLVKNHIREEEATMFKIAVKELSAIEFDALSRDYIVKCALYLEEDLNPPLEIGEPLTTIEYR